MLISAGAVAAQPVPLPYRSQAPFIPTVDLFGGPNKGLILGAEDVDRGRPAPLTIGNTTFFPQVKRAGALYGGFTRVDGDLQIINGDLYLGDQGVGATLQQHTTRLDQQGATLDAHGLQLQQHQGQIGVLQSGAAQMQQVMEQQGVSLQQHAVAINGLATEMAEAQQNIARLDQNITNLGSGVAGATALAAALASLPVESAQSPLSCGIGSGGYSDRYALAMGCSVNLASALSLNAGGAYLFGGSSSYGAGSLSNVAGRFGLAYRFGSSASGAKGDRGAGGQVVHRQIEALQAENQQLRQWIAQINQRVEALQPAANVLGMR